MNPTKLFVIEGYKRLCFVRERDSSPLQYAIYEGEVQELYAGAGGKLLLAFASEAFQRKVIQRKREKFTDQTITDPDALLKELKVIRQQAYAASKGELVSEVAVWRRRFMITKARYAPP